MELDNETIVITGSEPLTGKATVTSTVKAKSFSLWVKLTTCCSQASCLWCFACSTATTIGLILGALAVAGLVIAASFGGFDNPGRFFERSLHVAFVGPRALSLNDLPRVMEAISNGKWTQQSCIHSRGSLVTMLKTGNGMYSIWHKRAAYLQDKQVYDYGTCTVEELFSGFDDMLTENNYNGYYYNDGRNPCFQDSDYYTYSKANEIVNETVKYDYVFYTDHAKRMAVNETRDATLEYLAGTYSKYMIQVNAVPVVVSPHAFWSHQVNMTGMDSVAHFTALIWDATLEFQAVMGGLIAPVSLAFLTVYEENPDLWTLLLDSYGLHASLYGTYLTSCVLFATVTKRMPSKGQWIDTQSLFNNSRSMWGSVWGYPSETDAEYLWDVAMRVTLQNYKPSTMM